MIGRLWRGWTTAGNAPAYEEHLRRETLPALERIDGFAGAHVLRRETDGGIEIVVITLWQSLDAVRAFAGEAYETAVIPPEARKLLARFDATVLHYDVALTCI
jgi:heme-degrading monooxygenase HmoA